MSPHDAELKKELDAALETRKELGPEYEDDLVEGFLERIDHRLDTVVETRLRRRSAELQVEGARRSRPSGGTGDSPGTVFGLAAVSLVVAVPLSAIAAVNTGLLGLTVAWLGIVGVNAVHAADRLPFGGGARRQDDRG